MRKFRFTGNPDTYNWDFKLEKNKVYSGDTIAFKGLSIQFLFVDQSMGMGSFWFDWSEVFENQDTLTIPLTPNESYTNLAIVKPVNEEKFINDCAVHAMNSWLGSNPKRIAKDSFDIAYAMNEERKRRLNEEHQAPN